MKRMLKSTDTMGIIDETFDIYKRDFLLFVGMAAVVHIPIGILTGLMREDRRPILTMLLMMPLGYIVQAAATHAVSGRYLGQNPTIPASYTAILRRAFPFAGTILLASISIGVGAFLFVIPGLILSFRYAFISQVFIVEGLSGADAWRRSRQLAAKEWGRIFTFELLAALVSFAAQVVMAVVLGVFLALAKIPPHGPAAGVVIELATGIVSSITVPLYAISFILLYYDIRIRKEGLDIEMPAQNLSGEAPTPAQQEVPALDLGTGDG